MRLLVSLFSILGLFATTAVAGTILSLKTEVTVNAARVKLSDISDIEIDGVKENEVGGKSLGAIDLGSAPLPGYQSRYNRKDIERIIRASGQMHGAEWRGADVVKVERLAKIFDSAQLANIAGAYLKQVLSNGQNRIEIEVIEKLPEIMLAEGKLDIKPRTLSRAEAMHTNVTVWLDIFIAGVFSRSVRVPVKVKVIEDALVAKHDLVKGTTPVCEDLLIREIDVASLDGMSLSADCAMLKGILKKNIPAGAALSRNYMQIPSAISHGETINLMLNMGALVLESKAIAMTDGEIGQRIKVKPAAATDTIAAIVVAPGVAKVIGN